MFPFLQSPIRLLKAAGTAALQDAPAIQSHRLAKRLSFNREWTRRNANEAEHPFSLREKVADGRMRVKTLG
jgi:hypothetical protein